MSLERIATRTMFKTLFLAIGVLFAWQTFDIVLKRTGDSFFALSSLAIVLAFWIGVYKLSIKVRTSF